MKRHLLTPSLHNEWRFYNLLESKGKEDFLNTLRKVKGPPTEAMQTGIDFEDDVKAICDNSPAVPYPLRVQQDQKYGQCVLQIAEIVQGGLWQERVYIDMRLQGIDFLLYGNADVVKRNWVYDIKYTGNYDIGKFCDSIQHDTYLVGSRLPYFKYLITDGRSWWAEDYAMTDKTEERLRGELAEMVDGIYSDADFRQAYEENWGAKY